MFVMTLFWIFCLGLIVGSFLNVVIVRLGTGFSVAHGRSICFSCGKQLTWRELFPLVSFLIQKGKCRGCKSRLSWQYPLIEFFTAVTFVFVFLKIQPVDVFTYFIFLIYLCIFSLLVVVVGYDSRHKIIPDGISYSFSLISLCLIFLVNNLSNLEISSLLAGPVLASFFLFLWFITKGRGVGLGDAKLSLGIGWLLGLSGGIAAVLMAFWVGTIVSLAIMSWQKLSGAKGLSLKSEIPFGPFLIVGLYISFFGNVTFETISAFLSF